VTAAAPAQADGLTVRAYGGDRTTLLGFDVPEALADDLAGFAIAWTDPEGRTQWIPNRLSFDLAITADTTPAQRRWTPSNEAPFQKFRWAHFPPEAAPGTYTYHVNAMLFRRGTETELEPGPSADVAVEVGGVDRPSFELGFTRGYVSSQAYRDRFQNAPFRPDPPTIDYDTAPYERQYRWLGAHAREMLFDFLEECVRDESLEVDVFAYDLDEPDLVRRLQELGSRLRLYLDNSHDHVESGALEVDAKELVERSAGSDRVRSGHFGRFAHDKVLIQRRDGRAVKVLTGSANFSVRGLYVQANSVLIFADASTPTLYANVFDNVWDDARGFARSELAARWFPVEEPDVPPFSVSFAPHRDAGISLDLVAEAIGGADSSVLFAVMTLGGGGRVLQALRELTTRGNVFSYGMTQHVDGSLELTAPGTASGVLVPFAFLSEHVPPPFNKEWSGGSGRVIHHKFVVVDFNDARPLVFTGSSNLASGGETSNGDNLLAFTDRSVATAYAVEAVRLIDHYQFRAAMRKATDEEPLHLKPRSARWWLPYYTPGERKERERRIFVASPPDGAAPEP
jgi:PLD-like domain